MSRFVGAGLCRVADAIFVSVRAGAGLFGKVFGRSA